MKRILGLLVLALLLAGCGAEEVVPTTVPVVPTEPSAPAVLEEVFSTEPEARKYEGVTLTVAPGVEETEAVAAVYRQAAAVFSAGTGAEVVLSWGADAGGDVHLVPWGGDASGAMDLTALAEQAEYETHSYQSLTTQVAGHYGYLAGLPHIPYAGGVYYNVAVFDSCGIEAPPATWADFLAVCQTLREQGWETLALNTEDAYSASWLHFERSQGTAGLSKAGQVELLAKQIMELQAAGLLPTGTPAAAPGGENRLALSNGTMTFGTNALCGRMEESTGMDLNWGVFPWPGGDKGTGCYACSDLLCISAGTKAPEAAFEFALLLCTGEFDQLRADVTNGLPADPGNSSPVRGAAAILEKAVLTGIPEPTKKQELSAQRLWAGYYKKATDFSKVWYDPA